MSFMGSRSSRALPSPTATSIGWAAAWDGWGQGYYFAKLEDAREAFIAEWRRQVTP